MSETTALAIEGGLMILCGIAAVIAAVFYKQTKGDMGGVTFAIFAFITISLGANIVHATEKVLK